jgi:hypothetical protein
VPDRHFVVAFVRAEIRGGEAAVVGAEHRLRRDAVFPAAMALHEHEARPLAARGEQHQRVDALEVIPHGISRRALDVDRIVKHAQAVRRKRHAQFVAVALRNA